VVSDAQGLGFFLELSDDGKRLYLEAERKGLYLLVK
jgi:hypothetical protein